MESRNGMFVTAFMAILDPKTGILTYSNAGHNLPIWYKTNNKECSRLEMDGIALGVTSEAVYTDKEIQLEQDDFLLFYTDGVTEALSDTEQFFTEQRLFDFMKKRKYKTSSELLTKLMDMIQKFRNGESPYDDLTVISVHKLEWKPPLSVGVSNFWGAIHFWEVYLPEINANQICQLDIGVGTGVDSMNDWGVVPAGDSGMINFSPGRAIWPSLYAHCSTAPSEEA